MEDIYNRYRPRTFKEMYPTSDFGSQVEWLIANTLKGEKPALPHFILLHSEYGGLGKTTAGRIMAMLLNPDMEPLDKERIHKGERNIYFFEINGGDFRKIDDIRKMAREIEYKRDTLLNHRCVYMINEAHQLTADAQQVFLQVTENIPENIYLIFTSTSLDSFNEKLRGRMQKFKFKPLNRQALGKLLVDIAKQETGIVLQEYVVDQIFEKCGFSVRESINSLGEYLVTGRVAGSENSSEEDPYYFSELIEIFEGVCLGEKISWTKRVVPLLESMLASVSVEEARIKLMYRLVRVLTNRNGIRGVGNGKDVQLHSISHKGELYRRLAVRLKEPVGYPQKSDFIMSVYLMYMDAREVAGT